MTQTARETLCSYPLSHLMPLFKAEPKVDKLEALIVRAPENVARLEISVNVSFSVQETQRLQNIASTVLDQPHGVTLAATSHQQLWHTHIQKLQQQAAGGYAEQVVIGKHAIQRNCGWRKKTGNMNMGRLLTVRCISIHPQWLHHCLVPNRYFMMIIYHLLHSLIMLQSFLSSHTKNSTWC